MKTEKERDIVIFNLGKQFLIGLGYAEINEELLKRYFKSPTRQISIAGIYKKMLFSAREANMKQNVLTNYIGEDVENLSELLEGFDPKLVKKKYYKDEEKQLVNQWQGLFADIQKKIIDPEVDVSRDLKGILPQYCKTILSVADFLSGFSSAEDFYCWVDKWENFILEDKRNRLALPLLIKSELHGFGFALSCNILKDLGVSSLAKPDTHLKGIFKQLGLCRQDADDYEVFKAILRMAEHLEQTGYAVDKLFWLIGSGYFHDDPQIGENGRIGGRKQEFINYIQKQIT